jgi:hypothetical protein
MSSLNDVVTAIKNAVVAINNVAKTMGATYLSVAGDQTLTGTNTFKIPPVINAGAVGIGTVEPMGRLSSQFSVAGIGNGADTTDDTLFTYTLPASSFDVVGRGVVIEAFGKFAANADNKTVKLFFGASSYSSGVQTGSGVGWYIRMEIFKQAANVQIGTGRGEAGAVLFAAALPINGAETDSGAIVLKVTGASPTTGAADDVLGMGMAVTFIN